MLRVLSSVRGRVIEEGLMYLVFDVGATFIKYALMDDEGNISGKGTPGRVHMRKITIMLHTIIFILPMLNIPSTFSGHRKIRFNVNTSGSNLR